MQKRDAAWAAEVDGVYRISKLTDPNQSCQKRTRKNQEEASMKIYIRVSFNCVLGSNNRLDMQNERAKRQGENVDRFGLQLVINELGRSLKNIIRTWRILPPSKVYDMAGSTLSGAWYEEKDKIQEENLRLICAAVGLLLIEMRCRSFETEL